MTDSLAGLEHHHFKYVRFCRSGDVHVHVFGAAVLSFASGGRPAARAVFTISAVTFTRPLRKVLRFSPAAPTRATQR